jgi:putative MATE family efflux protein
MRSQHDLTTGNITSGLWAFAVPLMLGNVLQQLYNLADTWVVGKCIGNNALAAVGASYTLMIFLTSVIIGLCLGSSAFIAMAYGKKNTEKIKNGIFLSFAFTALITVLLIVLFCAGLDTIIKWLRVPQETVSDMRIYLFYVFMGFFATFIYNYISNLLRGLGNSVVPLFFLALSVVLNIALDILFVAGFQMGIAGAAQATVLAQHISGFGLLIYYWIKYPGLRLHKKDCVWNREDFMEILSLSGFTCLQQSVMNFGILMVQGLVNSFGAVVMAAFAVAVKIDTIAYMPVQDFGNAFSVFVAQNFSAGKKDRIRAGMKSAGISVAVFCAVISTAVCVFAKTLMQIFVSGSDEVVRTGVQYLRIEGMFYIGIGILFMLYGYYRAVSRPGVSVVLTVISLGTRVLLAYTLSAVSWIGVAGIWGSIPIGWFLADFAGILLLKRSRTLKKSQDTV